MNVDHPNSIPMGTISSVDVTSSESVYADVKSMSPDDMPPKLSVRTGTTTTTSMPAITTTSFLNTNDVSVSSSTPVSQIDRMNVDHPNSIPMGTISSVDVTSSESVYADVKSMSPDDMPPKLSVRTGTTTTTSMPAITTTSFLNTNDVSVSSSTPDTWTRITKGIGRLWIAATNFASTDPGFFTIRIPHNDSDQHPPDKLETLSPGDSAHNLTSITELPREKVSTKNPNEELITTLDSSFGDSVINVTEITKSPAGVDSKTLSNEVMSDNHTTYVPVTPRPDHQPINTSETSLVRNTTHEPVLTDGVEAPSSDNFTTLIPVSTVSPPKISSIRNTEIDLPNDELSTVNDLPEPSTTNSPAERNTELQPDLTTHPSTPDLTTDSNYIPRTRKFFTTVSLPEISLIRNTEIDLPDGDLPKVNHLPEPSTTISPAERNTELQPDLTTQPSTPDLTTDSNYIPGTRKFFTTVSPPEISLIRNTETDLPNDDLPTVNDLVEPSINTTMKLAAYTNPGFVVIVCTAGLFSVYMLMTLLVYALRKNSMKKKLNLDQSQPVFGDYFMSTLATNEHVTFDSVSPLSIENQNYRRINPEHDTFFSVDLHSFR